MRNGLPRPLRRQGPRRDGFAAPRLPANLARLRARHTIALTAFAECAGCPYIAACTGNCPGAGAVLTGDAYRPSPDACLRRFLDDGGRVPQAAPA